MKTRDEDRQQQINLLFDVLAHKKLILGSQYHEFCRWAKDRNPTDIYRMAFSKRNPMNLGV